MKISLLVLLIMATLSSAYSGYNRPVVKSLSPIAVAVEMKDAGLVNLNTEVSLILEREGDKKVYNSDEYQAMMAELELEIQGRIVDIVLGKGTISREDISKIKKEVDMEMAKLIGEKKKAYFGEKEVKVGCRVTSLYVTNLGVQVNGGLPNSRW